MLKEAGCTHVLVGHSERRQLFGETDEGSTAGPRRLGLGPLAIVASGKPSRSARPDGRRSGRRPACRGPQGPVGEDMERVLIAYEPVWAIGTEGRPRRPRPRRSTPISGGASKKTMETARPPVL